MRERKVKNSENSYRIVTSQFGDQRFKGCMIWKVEGISQRGCPKMTRWDCVKDDMESFGRSQKDAQFRNKW